MISQEHKHSCRVTPSPGHCVRLGSQISEGREVRARKNILYVPKNRDLNNANVLWAIKELCKMFDIPFCRVRCMRISVNILRQSVTSLNVIYDIWPNFAWVSDYNFFSLLYMHCIVMNLTIICGFFVLCFDSKEMFASSNLHFAPASMRKWFICLPRFCSWSKINLRSQKWQIDPNHLHLRSCNPLMIWQHHRHTRQLSPGERRDG